NDVFDNYRRAAGYVDRLLKGGKPSELPVQAPLKFELVLHLKTPKALRFEVAPTPLPRADGGHELRNLYFIGEPRHTWHCNLANAGLRLDVLLRCPNQEVFQNVFFVWGASDRLQTLQWISR